MATGQETLQLILTGSDQGAGAVIKSLNQSTADLRQKAEGMAGALSSTGAGLDQIAGGAEKAHLHTRPLISSVAMLGEQFGILGPSGHLAGYALLEFAQSGSVALSTLGVGVGVAALGVLIETLMAFKERSKQAAEEAKKLKDAVRAGDFEAFAKQIEVATDDLEKFQKAEKLLTPPAGMMGQGLAVMQAQEDRVAAAVAKTTEELKKAQASYDAIDATKAAFTTQKFALELGLIDAGPLEKVVLQARQAYLELEKLNTANKITPRDYTAALLGIGAAVEANIGKTRREIDAIGQYSEAVQKNVDLQLQLQLLAAQKKGDTTAVEAITRQRDALKENFQLNIQLSEQQTKFATQQERLNQLKAAGDTAAAALVQIEIAATQRRMGLITQEITLQNQLRAARDNAMKLIDPSKELTAIEAAIDQAFRSGNKPTQDMVNNWSTALNQLQQNAYRNFGVNIPADVQASIDKVEALMKKVAEAAGIDVKPLEDKLKSAFSGGSYAGLGPQGTLDEFRAVEKTTGELTELTANWNKELAGAAVTITNMNAVTGGWKNEIKEINGVWTNVEDSSEGAQKDIKSIPDILKQATGAAGQLAESFKLAKDNAASLIAQIDAIGQQIAAINAQGGVKVVQ